MKKAKHDELAAQQMRESIAVRMEAFGDEFERVAGTAQQGALAERFKMTVQEVVNVPVGAAEIQPLGEWLAGYGAQFERQARTAEQKALTASFRTFIAEITGPEVKDVFQRPLVNELVEEIKSALADGHSNGIPIAWLSDADKREFLGVVIDWTDYINRGLDLERDTAGHIEHIVENAIAGKPSGQWMPRADPHADQFADLLNRHSGQVARLPENDKDRGLDR